MSSIEIYWILAILITIGAATFCMIKTKTYKTATIFAICSFLVPFAWVGNDCIKTVGYEACNGGITWMPVYLTVSIVIGCLFYLFWTLLDFSIRLLINLVKR